MDIKLLKSQINLIEAQIKQLAECGLFSDDEINRLSRPLKIELARLHPKLEELLADINPDDLEVNDHQIVS